MSEQNKPFIITDRRKFTLDGELRPDAEISHEPESEESPRPIEAAAPPPPAPEPEPSSEPEEDDLPPALTDEQTSQAKFAYDQTADRLDTAIRAANPGMDHLPPMNFERLVQSIYMTSLVQLGATTPEGEKPRVDLMGARQSIDMLGVLADKTKGNLSEMEQRLLDSALFELRMAFLEITQAIARSAAAQQGPGGPAGPGVPGGRPSIVR